MQRVPMEPHDRSLPATYPAAIARPAHTTLPLAVALLITTIAIALGFPAHGTAGGGEHPKLTDLRCLSGCAGLRAGAVGGKVILHGKRLAAVDEVVFAGDPAQVAIPPKSVDRRRVVAVIPSGAASGRPRVTTPADAQSISPKRLAVVDGSEVPAPGRLELGASQVRPRRAFFDEPGKLKLNYRFTAEGRTGVRIEVVRRKGDHVVKNWRHKGQLPYTGHRQTWNGLEKDGDVANDGAYRFRVGAFGRRSFAAGALKFFGHRFPVRGSHGYGGYLQSFGAPRSGGRRHQGQDVYASCGTPLEAARGGRIQAKDYDPVLYGHYVVIDARKTSADHMYAHMPSPSRFGRGSRVHTGERIGAVGRTGNARTTPCHLHFEIWPNGWHHGSPVDPKPALRRWDAWS
jgi:murein DD-endopeptidase MepM/ murein hydrolase activator NlpD